MMINQRWLPQHWFSLPSRLVQLLNHEHFSFFVALIFAWISAIPMYATSTINRDYPLAPYQWDKMDLYTINFNQRITYIMMAAVCIPMFADVTIDWYVWFFVDDILKQQQDKLSKKKDVIPVTRLNMMERFIFLFGASLQPLVIFNFVDGDLIPNFAAASASFYTGTFLMSIAVLCFLQRCTKVWTAGRTNTCLIIMGFGCIFKNFRYIIINYDLRITLYDCGNYLLVISFGFQMLFTLMCFVTYCAEKYKLHQERKNAATVKLVHGDDIQSRIDACDEFYTNYVPAGHMVVLMLSCCSDIYYLHGPTAGIYSDQVLWERVVATAMLIITVVIIVLESRIKHNEVERTMLRELMSTKKSYVRYLSHELRTPLNTTFLGIGLLADEIKDSKDPDDQERFNILRSMNVACKSAVDILDDLITFDKLESGHLKIHQQVANIPTLLREGVEACVVDARLAEVDLALYLDVEAAEAYCNFLRSAWQQGRSGRFSKGRQGNVLNEDYLLTADNSNRDIASDDNMHVDPVKCQQVLHSLVVFCIKQAHSHGLVDVYAMCSESPNNDFGLSMHSVGSGRSSRSGAIMNSIYQSAAGVSASSAIKRNGSMGSFRALPPENLVPLVSRALNGDSPRNSSHNSPVNSRKNDGSQIRPISQSNKESSFRHSFRKEQRSFRQALNVDQRPMLLPSLQLPDASDKDLSLKGNGAGPGFWPSDEGKIDHPQVSMTAAAAAMDLLVPSDKDMGAKISSLGHSEKSTRPSLQRLALARDLDPLAPAAQTTTNPQTSATPASFMSRVLRSSLDALPRLGLSLPTVEPSRNNNPPQHSLSHLHSQQSHLSILSVSHKSSRYSRDSAPLRASMEQLPHSARIRLSRDAPPDGSTDESPHFNTLARNTRDGPPRGSMDEQPNSARGPNSARSSGARSHRLSTEGKVPVFVSRVPGSPASASREASRYNSPKTSIVPPAVSDCVNGMLVESTKVDYLASMGTAREALVRGGEEDNDDRSNNSMLVRSGNAPRSDGERSIRAIRLSKDVIADPSEDVPLPMDMRVLGALQQQLDQQHDHTRQQKKKERRTLVPLRDPMRSQVPTPRSNDRDDDAAGGGGGNSDGGNSARKARHGSMALINQVLFARASNKAASHREHRGPEWLTIVIVAKGQGLDMSDNSDEIIASRVPSEIRPFSPDHLVAGGSADMSLWIAKGIVEQHGGRIHMFSGAVGSSDLGCHFIVELPLQSRTHPLKDQDYDPRGVRGAVSGTADASAAVSSSRVWASGHPEAPSPGGASVREELNRVSEDDYADTPKDKKGTSGGSLFDRGVGYLRRMSTEKISGIDRSKIVPVAEEATTPSTRARRVLNAPSGRGSQDSAASRDSLESILLPPGHTRINSTEAVYRQLKAGTSANADLVDRTAAAAPSSNLEKLMTTPSASLSLQLPSATHSSPTHSHPPRELQPLVAKKKKTLLVVDDSDLTRKMLCRIVRAQGFDVEEAEDGDVAVQMVQRRLDTLAVEPPRTTGGQRSSSGYECILMDFIMPRLDGPSATKEIRDLGYTGLVLGVTGNGQEFDVKHFKHMGANEVFTKPLDVTRLKEYLRQHNIVAT